LDGWFSMPARLIWVASHAAEKGPAMNHPRRKSSPADGETGARNRREKALDDALKNTFPASDPVSIEQPLPPHEPARHEGKKRKPPRFHN
jgi:hypothetical protein